MLHLIASLLPRPLHRAGLGIAHRLRHWYRWALRKPIVGVSLLLENEVGHLLLVRHSYGPDRWALPGGGLERGEAPIEAARRELAEELDGTADDLRVFTRFRETISGAPHTAHLCAGTLREAPRPDRREIVEARFFPLDALPDDIGEGTRRRIALWKVRDAPLEQA